MYIGCDQLQNKKEETVITFIVGILQVQKYLDNVPWVS